MNPGVQYRQRPVPTADIPELGRGLDRLQKQAPDGIALPVCQPELGDLPEPEHRDVLAVDPGPAGRAEDRTSRAGRGSASHRCGTSSSTAGHSGRRSAPQWRRHRQYHVAALLGLLTANTVLRRFGEHRVVFTAGLLAAVGLLIAVTIPNAVGAISGLLLVGFAVTPIVPVALSLAGRSAPGRSGQALATTTAAGYSASCVSSRSSAPRSSRMLAHR